MYQFLIEDLLFSCFKPGSLVLDAGCGDGGSIRREVPQNVMLVGIDIVRKNLIIAKQRWKNRSFVVADLTHLPFVEKTFDGTFCVNVLEHVHHKENAVEELAKVTDKNGFFIGCSTNVINPVFWLDVHFPSIMMPLVMKLSFSDHYERHSRFSPSSLSKTLVTSGFKLDYFALLGLPVFRTEEYSLLVYAWIVFDKLTKKAPLLYLKEEMVWKALRIHSSQHNS
jgi:ubiquinone/menaquinone biosynthesis C-methylase UbiE